MRTVKRDPEELLNAVNQLKPNLLFSLEKSNEKGDLAFFDNDVNVDTQKF